LFTFRQSPVPEVLQKIPELRGRRIDVCFRPSLTAYRGKILSGSSRGSAVFAGSFLRRRKIVLEEQMLRTPRILARIFVHEVFHFVWSRLGNRLRVSYEELVSREMDCRARGELGWSAESLKLQLGPEDRTNRSRRWKDYVCESFCDTAGWIFGTATRYPDMTLARRFRERRKQWFRECIAGRQLAI
jgi:hypothetical protein